MLRENGSGGDVERRDKLVQIPVHFEYTVGETERAVLVDVLRCCTDDEVNDAVCRIAKAALTEYMEMILGKQLPTRANEIHERRLYHLLKNYFNGRIPTEAEIASLFQMVQSSSRTLLRNVRTKYKFDLEQELSSTAISILTAAKQARDGYRVVIQSENILEELQQIVSIKAPHLDQISKVRSSVGVYSIPEDTLEVLCNHYGISLADIAAATARE